MINYLNDYFATLKYSTFKKYASIVSFFSDLIILFYLNNILISKYLNKSFLYNIFLIQGINLNSLPQHELENYLSMMRNNVSLIFWIILIYNSIIYLCNIKGYHWAEKYVRGYVLTGSLLSVIEIVLTLAFSNSINFYTLFSALGYTWVYLGFRHFKEKVER